MNPNRYGKTVSACVLACLLMACSGPPAPSDQADRTAILTQMHASWDRPGTPLEVGPVAIDGDYAVADWTQGAMGGRALLKREREGWATVLCAGDGIRSAEGLAAVGVPSVIAARLARQLADAEKQVPEERLMRMASFRGLVRMKQGAGHDAGH